MATNDSEDSLTNATDRSLAELIEATKQTPPLCWKAYEALASHPSNEAIAALAQLVNHPDWTHKRAAIAGIGNHKNGIQLKDLLLTFLTNSNTFIVLATIRALAKMKSTKAHEKIQPFTQSGELPIRQAAIEALRTIWQKSDFDYLIELYSSEKQEAIQKTIGFVLVEQVNAENWEAFFSLFKNDLLARHRLWALQIATQYSSDKIKYANYFLQDLDGHIQKRVKQIKLIASR